MQFPSDMDGATSLARSCYGPKAAKPQPSARERERVDPPEVGPVAKDGELDPVPCGRPGGQGLAGGGPK